MGCMGASFRAATIKETKGELEILKQILKKHHKNKRNIQYFKQTLDKIQISSNILNIADRKIEFFKLP